MILTQEVSQSSYHPLTDLDDISQKIISRVRCTNCKKLLKLDTGLIKIDYWQGKASNGVPEIIWWHDKCNVENKHKKRVGRF